jgi:hypothetical protein
MRRKEKLPKKKLCEREIPQPRRGEYKLCWFTHTHERKKSREMRDTRKGNQLSPAEEKKKNKDVKVFPALLLSSISSSSSSWNSICSYPNSDMMTSVQWGEGFHNSKWENSRRRDSERESLQKIFIHARRNMCLRPYTVWLCARKKKTSLGRLILLLLQLSAFVNLATLIFHVVFTRKKFEIFRLSSCWRSFVTVINQNPLRLLGSL